MQDNIKMTDLYALHQPIQAEIMAAFSQVLRCSDFINGQAVGAFMQEIKAYTGSAHAIGCGNGTDALQLALMTLDLPRGAEVIIPAFNYVSAAEVAALLGYTPVFADVNPQTFNLDPDSLSQCLSANTAAVMVAHLFGQCADLGRIMALTRQKRIWVIEDNAQSLGAACTLADGSLAMGGTIGQVGTTSFFPTKMLGALGDGGAVFTQSEKLARRISQTACHGQENKYNFARVGINSRLDSLQAAILAVKLPYLQEHIRARQQVARWYDQALQGQEGLQTPLVSPGNTHVYNQYTLQVDPRLRDALRQYLDAQQIPTMVYYSQALHLQPAYQYLGYKKGDFPVAERLCQSVLSLPMHPLLTTSQVTFISDKIREFFHQQGL